MDIVALLGIILIIYSIFIIYITVKKPPSIWDMAKIKLFRKMLGDKGTEVFFYIFALAAVAIGVWLMVK